jgi:hypothetical protein
MADPEHRNNETKDALAWLEKNYDPQDYSFWQVDYKYNDELTQSQPLSLLHLTELYFLTFFLILFFSLHELQPHWWFPHSP